MRFPGFPPEALEFFRGLARNNNRDWFLPRKAVFEEQVKQPMRELVDGAEPALARLRAGVRHRSRQGHLPLLSRHAFQQGQDALQGPHRRQFPFAAAPPARARRLSISPFRTRKWRSAAACTCRSRPRCWPSATTSRITTRSCAHPGGPKVRRLLGELQGEQLARVPKGFACDHPAADLLRFKQFLLYVELPPDVATSPALYQEIVDRFSAITPFLRFLNAPLPKEKKIDARDLLP